MDTGMIVNAAAGAGALVGGSIAGWHSRRTRHEMRNGFKHALVEEIVEQVSDRVDARCDRIEAQADARFEATGRLLAEHFKSGH